ncbi:hypothetical protein JQ594_06930 [Bradyrhizobium manausense]|uniref:hypothetical protein n=1 Tax=Bradyrhizobium manausense TaxID=989370 RepID=UPI001BA4C4F0|nr:hypothetical protein [Bradyrhizobium manausense]MBR0685644.1 hypothetical protein [Bradyrhizobium manausense]
MTAVSISLGLAPATAFAWDWSLRTSESQTVELNSNQFLRSSPAGSLGSYSTITGTAEALTPTSKLTLDGDGSYRNYWGPGAQGVPESISYGATARYDQFGKNNLDREFVEAAWRQQSTSLALLNDLGVVSPAGGFIDRFTATGGIDRAFNARDSISLLATSTRTYYEPSSGGTAFTDTIARGSWRHGTSSTTGVNLSSEAELLAYDNAFSTQINIFRNQVGVDTALSPLLSFRGNIGAAYLVTDRGVSTSAIGGVNSTVPIGSTSLDWIGDAILTYKFMKTATLSVLASQTVGPSIVGSLIKRDSLSASVNYLINSRENLTISASGNRQITGTTTDYASVSATYGYNPIQDVSLQFTYRYQHRFASTGTTTFDPLTGTPTVSGTGPADSHSVMFVATHNFLVLPHGN